MTMRTRPSSCCAAGSPSISATARSSSARAISSSCRDGVEHRPRSLTEQPVVLMFERGDEADNAIGRLQPADAAKLRAIDLRPAIASSTWTYRARSTCVGTTARCWTTLPMIVASSSVTANWRFAAQAIAIGIGSRTGTLRSSLRVAGRGHPRSRQTSITADCYGIRVVTVHALTAQDIDVHSRRQEHQGAGAGPDRQDRHVPYRAGARLSRHQDGRRHPPQEGRRDLDRRRRRATCRSSPPSPRARKRPAPTLRWSMCRRRVPPRRSSRRSRRRSR